MNRTSDLISAAMTLALGILFLILKGDVIGIALTVLGVALLVTAIVDLVRQSITSGVVKAVLGVVVLVFGWIFLEIAMLILGIVLLIFGILGLVKRITALKYAQKILATVLGFIEPIVCIIASVFLITSTGEALNWAIVVGGICLIVDGVLALIAALLAKK